MRCRMLPPVLAMQQERGDSLVFDLGSQFNTLLFICVTRSSLNHNPYCIYLYIKSTMFAMTEMFIMYTRYSNTNKHRCIKLPI